MPDLQGSYLQISQDEAKRIMAEKSGYQIVDVRRQDEFSQGHIPGAICIPNESINFDMMLLVYCRSGRRSKEAAQKLADLGYTNVLEFGGIITWTGSVTTE